jgi:hypothetical protein
VLLVISIGKYLPLVFYLFVPYQWNGRIDGMLYISIVVTFLVEMFADVNGNM